MAGSITIAFPASGSSAPVEMGNLKYACGSWQRPVGTSQPAVVHGMILGASEHTPARPPDGQTTPGNVSGQTWNFNTNMLPGAALGVDAKLVVWLDVEDCGCYFVAETTFTGCTEGTSDCHPPGDECNEPSGRSPDQTSFVAQMRMERRNVGSPPRGDVVTPIAVKPAALKPPVVKPAKSVEQTVVRDVAPRTYLVQLEPRSLGLSEPVGGMYRGGLVAFPKVALHYAPDRSSLVRAVWRSPQAAQAGTELVLEMTRGSCGRLRATLTLHRIDGSKVLAPLTWTLLGFDLMHGGTLDQASAPKGYALGRMHVVRAA